MAENEEKLLRTIELFMARSRSRSPFLNAEWIGMASAFLATLVTLVIWISNLRRDVDDNLKTTATIQATNFEAHKQHNAADIRHDADITELRRDIKDVNREIERLSKKP